MNIEIVNIAGVPMRVLMVDSLTPYTACENCGKPNYNHPELAKEDTDWCTACNDKVYRADWSEQQMSQYVMEQVRLGKIVLVASREPKDNWEETDVKVARHKKQEE